MSLYDNCYQKSVNHFKNLPQSSRDQVLEYITHLIHRQLSPMTIRIIIYLLKQFSEFLLCSEGGNLSQVSRNSIRSYLAHLSERNLKASTINSHLSCLYGLFTYLQDEEYIPHNPVLKRYYLITDHRLPHPMAPEDVPIFLKALEHPRDKALYLLMLRSGLRASEAAKLQISDVNERTQQVLVKNGKGKFDRMVYFTQDFQEALAHWLQVRKGESPYCFNSLTRPKQAVCYMQVYTRMQAILKNCGLEGKGYSPHTLRHTYATSLLNAGIPLEVLKDLMGHKRLDQTLQYAKLSNSTIRASYYQAMDVLEKEDQFYSEEDYGLPEAV